MALFVDLEMNDEVADAYESSESKFREANRLKDMNNSRYQIQHGPNSARSRWDLPSLRRTRVSAVASHK
jgi:hypothetical protein